MDLSVIRRNLVFSPTFFTTRQMTEVGDVNKYCSVLPGSCCECAVNLFFFPEMGSVLNVLGAAKELRQLKVRLSLNLAQLLSF